MLQAKTRGGVIYLLIDPRNNHVRYVGQTDDIKQRLLCHRNQKRKPVGKWIAELESMGLSPEVRVVATIVEPLESNTWNGDIYRCIYAAEKSLIAFYHLHGAADLLNVADKPKRPKDRRASVVARSLARE